MDDTVLDDVTGWETRSVADGYEGLRSLVDGGFSGAVEAGRTWAFVVNGRVVAVADGRIEAFEDAPLTAYVAPDPGVALLYAMRETGSEARARYFTDDKPIAEADSELSSGGFTGYLELSENVLSGDYYVVYQGGRSSSVAFVGSSRRLVTGDEAYELADDEVGIYEVNPVDLEVIEVPEPGGATDEPGSTGADGTTDATAPTGPASAVDDREGDDSPSTAGGTPGSDAGDADESGGPGPDGPGVEAAGPDAADFEDGVGLDLGGAADDARGDVPTADDDPGGSEFDDVVGDADPDGAERPDAEDGRSTRDSPEIDLERSLSGERPRDRRADTGADGDAGPASEATEVTGSESGLEAEPDRSADGRSDRDRDRDQDADVATADTDGTDTDDTDGTGAAEPADGSSSDGADGRVGVSSPDVEPAGTPDEGSSGGPPSADGATAGAGAGTDSVADTADPAPVEDGPGVESGEADELTDADGTGDDDEEGSAAGAEAAASGTASTPETDTVGEESRGDPFSAEERWRRDQAIPALDPDESSTGESRGSRNGGDRVGAVDGRTDTGDRSGPRAGDGAPTPADDEVDGPDEGDGTVDTSDATSPADARDSPARSATGTGTGTGPDELRALRARLEEVEAERERAEERRRELAEELESLTDERDELTSRRDELVEERDALARERDSLAEERNRYRQRAEQLRSRVEELEAELEETRSELETARERAPEVPSGERVSRAEALRGAHVLVRYEQASGPTLTKARDGQVGRPEVNDNLRLEYHHTRFDADDAVVDGEGFSTFLTSTTQYRFVSWVVQELMYDLAETGNRDALERLYDAIPESNRAEFEGGVTVPVDDGEGHESLSFDVVIRDRMGNPLVVADLNTSRDAATKEQMSELVEKARKVAAFKEPFAGAFLVTASFFDPAALETADAATEDGGLLGGSGRRSYVKLSRRNGFHLCLVETRDGAFHINVPEL